MLERLNQKTIVLSLKELNDGSEQIWCIKNEKLHCQYKFPCFVSAFGFMMQVAMLAEKANHHPEWLNSYNKVVINLTTHKVGGISEKDFELARQISRIN